MTGRATPDPNEMQPALPGMPDTPQPLGRLDLTGAMRCSLSHALTEEFTGLRPLDYTEVTGEMVALAQPERLRTFVLDVKGDAFESPCALPYYDVAKKRDVYVALPPQEAKLVPFSVRGLAGSAGRRAAGSLPVSWHSAGERSRQSQAQAQSLEGKLPGMLNYRGMLEENRDLLKTFFIASRGENYGNSYFGSEATMREKLSYVRTFLIDEGLVAAYAHQKHLTPPQARLLSKTIEHNLFISPDKKDYFHEMIVFLREYNGRKLDVVTQRIDFIQRNIGKPVVAKTQSE